MSDKQSAGLLVIIGAIVFAIWYRSRSEAQREALVSGKAALKPEAFPATNAVFGPEPQAPGRAGGIGGRIESEAEQSLGKSTKEILPQYPRRACATFVSNVLASLGIIHGCYPTVRGLEPALGGAGAQEVAFGAGLSETGALKPGDVLLFANRSGLGHAAIYAGGGSIIGTSSSTEKVVEEPIGALGGTYQTYEAWRFK